MSGPLYPELSMCFEGARLTQLVQLVTAGRCQKIGLVGLMFFFELLFPYVSLAISFYVSLTNLFSIILFLICRLPETLKTKEKQDLILLIQETVQISFYDLGISQDSQTDHWIQW